MASVLTSVSGQFQIRRDRLTDQTYQFYPCQCDAASHAEPVTWQQAIALWQHSDEFRTLFTQALAQVPFEAFFWETPPLTASSLEAPWAWVTVDAPPLATVAPDLTPFSRYLNAARTESVTTFANLGGDALLIVPCQHGDVSLYTHLGTFVRSASAAQIHRLWQVLGQTLQQHWMTRHGQPLWVSTSGLGVYWLHLRLDDRPKYYTHPPYRTIP